MQDIYSRIPKVIKGISRYRYYTYVLLIIIFIFITLRIFVLLSSYELFRWDEVLTGTIAKDIIEGHSLPLTEYKKNFAKGPGLIHGFIGAIFFLIFGIKGCVLKLFPLLVNLGALLISSTTLKKIFGERVAIINSILYALSPPLFTMRSLVIDNIHFEVIFFNSLILLLFTRIFILYKEKEFSGNGILYILTGFICGFGIYFNYLTMAMIIPCLIAWLFIDKRLFFNKNFYFFIFSVFIGCAPLLIDFIYFKNIFRGEFHFVLTLCQPEVIFDKFISMFTTYLPDSFALTKILIFERGFVTYTYYFIFLVSFIVVVFVYYIKNKDSTKNNYSIFLFLIISYFFLYTTTFSVFYLTHIQYHMPGYVRYKNIFLLYPVIFSVIALFIDILYKVNKILGRLVLLVTLSLTLIANVELISFKNMKERSYLFYKSYDYITMGSCLAKKYKDDIPKALRFTYKFTGRKRLSCIAGLGLGLAEVFFIEKNDVASLLEVLNTQALSHEEKQFFIKGVGYFINDQVVAGESVNPQLENAIVLNSIPEEYKPIYLRAVGGYFYSFAENPSNAHWDNFCSFLENKNNFKANQRYYCYEGLGKSIGWAYGYNLNKCYNVIKALKVKNDYLLYIEKGMFDGISDCLL